MDNEKENNINFVLVDSAPAEPAKAEPVVENTAGGFGGSSANGNTADFSDGFVGSSSSFGGNNNFGGNSAGSSSDFGHSSANSNTTGFGGNDFGGNSNFGGNNNFGDNSNFSGSPEDGGKKKKPAKPKKDDPFVKRSSFIKWLAIAVAVSVALGAFIGVFVSKSMIKKTYKNLSYESLSAATGSKLTISEIAAKNENAVVEINTTGISQGYYGQQQITQGAGSGVIVKENGYIVTNYHVIEGASQISVTLHSGEDYGASIIGYDSDNDIAVIKIDASGLTVATIGDSDKLAVGDLVVAIGNPLGQLGGTVSQGIVSALERRLTIDDLTLNLIQTDAAINAGNSGGGLFNGAGQLIGIVVAKTSATGVEGLGFAIPINNVADIIDELISTGKVSAKASIGITIYDISESQAKQYDDVDAGVYIQEVTSSEAKSAGFKSGDRIISINGKEIESASDFVSRVKECEIGDTAKVVVERNDKEITIETKLIASTSNS